MKLLVILFLNMLLASCFVQKSKDSQNCQLIKNSIETLYFQKEFAVYQFDTILIYDKPKAIQNCENVNSTDKKVQITIDRMYNLSPEKYSPYKPKNLIILYDFKRQRGKYKLFFLETVFWRKRYTHI